MAPEAPVTTKKKKNAAARIGQPVPRPSGRATASANQKA